MTEAPCVTGALPASVPAPRRLDAATARLTWSTEGGSLVLHVDGLAHHGVWLELNLPREWIEARLAELAGGGA